MPHLIVGDTTDRTARIWVRGAWWCSTCDIAIDPPPPEHPAVRTIQLMPATDYTGTVDFEGLAPGTDYSVEATFSFLRRRSAFGRFHTFPPSLKEPEAFSFVLSSCNLSVVSVSNLLAFLLAMVGVRAATGSLELPLARWKMRWLFPLWVVARPVVRFVLMLIAMFVKTVTGMKQPAPPYIRSPFLKLSAVFESQVLEIDAGARVFLTAGDVVSTASGARGVVACSVEAVKDEKGNQTGTWRAVLTQVEGQFKEDDTAFKLPVGSPAPKHPAGRVSRWLVGRYRLPLSMEPWRWIGRISKVSNGRVWHEKPSFFVHAGDQIYYDFPFENRRPKTRQYRLAYREAWFDDYAHGHVLSHWPHYMTLDDHEIADQFARDFVPPANDSTPLAYLEKASVAYREYVHSRSPSSAGEAGRTATGSFWYSFDKGSTRFFVLDTRTQRLDSGVDGSQMIDERQMEALLKWMATPEYKEDLKFVVTSVPFVAEIDDTPSRPTPKWISQERPRGSAPSAVRRNPANDKWCATRFKRQRNQIIDHIAANDIEHLVFLTGDMHCCYHATMQIGSGSKYETTTVHELAGGPVNQLQLANVTDFHTRHAGRTSGNAYEVVLDRFHGEVNAVMHLKVGYESRELIVGTDRAGKSPIVDWNVIRTLTDDGPSPWVEPLSKDQKRAPEATMAGRITFVRKRRVEDLAPWPRAIV